MILIDAFMASRSASPEPLRNPRMAKDHLDQATWRFL